MLSSELSSHLQEIPKSSPQEIKALSVRFQRRFADNEDTIKSKIVICETWQQGVATEDSDNDNNLSSATIAILKPKFYSSKTTSSPTPTSGLPPESSAPVVNVGSSKLLQTNSGHMEHSEWQRRVSAKRREFHCQMLTNLKAQRELIQEKEAVKQECERKYLLQLQESHQWKLSALQYKRQLVQQLVLSESLRRQTVLLRAHGSALTDQIILLKRDNSQMQIRNRYVQKELEKAKSSEYRCQRSANAAVRVPSPPLLHYNRHRRSHSNPLCLRPLPRISECVDTYTGDGDRGQPSHRARSMSLGHAPLPHTNRIA